MDLIVCTCTLSLSDLCPFFFLQNNIKATDALILLFPIVLQRECVSPKAMLKVVPAIAASKGLLP